LVLQPAIVVLVASELIYLGHDHEVPWAVSRSPYDLLRSNERRVSSCRHGYNFLDMHCSVRGFASSNLHVLGMSFGAVVLGHQS
jgi:hypothetical protein